MPDPKDKRLMRWFGFTWFLLLVMLIVLIYALTHEDKQDVHNHYIDKPEDSAYQVALKNGFTGNEIEWLESLKGSDGIDGRNGMDGTRVEVIREIVVERTTPMKGDTGDPGTDGRMPELQWNPETGLESRYEGDSFWQLLIPKCEIKDCSGE